MPKILRIFSWLSLEALPHPSPLTPHLLPQVQHTVVLNECDMGTFGHVWVDSTEGSLAIVHKEETMVGVTRSVDAILAAYY